MERKENADFSLGNSIERRTRAFQTEPLGFRTGRAISERRPVQYGLEEYPVATASKKSPRNIWKSHSENPSVTKGQKILDSAVSTWPKFYSFEIESLIVLHFRANCFRSVLWLTLAFTRQALSRGHGALTAHTL